MRKWRDWGEGDGGRGGRLCGRSVSFVRGEGGTRKKEECKSHMTAPETGGWPVGQLRPVGCGGQTSPGTSEMSVRLSRA